MIEERGRTQFGAVTYGTTALFEKLFGLSGWTRCPTPRNSIPPRRTNASCASGCSRRVSSGSSERRLAAGLALAALAAGPWRRGGGRDPRGDGERAARGREVGARQGDQGRPDRGPGGRARRPRRGGDPRRRARGAADHRRAQAQGLRPGDASGDAALADPQHQPGWDADAYPQERSRRRPESELPFPLARRVPPSSGYYRVPGRPPSPRPRR